MRKIYLIAITVLLFSCSTNENNKEKKIVLAETVTKKDSASEKSCSKNNEITNPNGMSEMSAIMEEWYAELKRAGEVIKTGKVCTDIKVFDFEKVKSAQSTKEDIYGEVFNGFVDAYAMNYKKAANSKTIAEQVDNFNLTITACVNCHEQHCNGPVVRINKLRIK